MASGTDGGETLRPLQDADKYRWAPHLVLLNGPRDRRRRKSSVSRGPSPEDVDKVTRVLWDVSRKTKSSVDFFYSAKKL